MELIKELDTIIEEVTEEAGKFKDAESTADEIEALKEILDTLIRGVRQVQEKLDLYNDRRYRWKMAYFDKSLLILFQL